MSDLCVYLLGAPQVKRSGQPIIIERRKGLALLAYLAVTRQVHHRDALATLLWPDYDQSGARANLRRDLSRLKADLDGDLLLIEREQVSLSPDLDLCLDVAVFKSHLDRARDHGHSPRPDALPLCAGCLAALSEAVELYQGDFMAGFSLPDSTVFDEWQYYQSESLRQKLGEALIQLVQWHAQQEEYALSIGYCQRWLAIDRLHEPAHRQLMQLYALDGQQSAALRLYQECRRLLDEELGVEPEAETTGLYEAIRTRKFGPPGWAPGPESQPGREAGEPVERGETGRPAAAGRKPVHNLPRQATHFVGRERELAEIQQLLLADPDARLLTIVGPGGSGKTRLAIQVGLQASDERKDGFADGVWYVQLAPLTQPSSIVPAIEKALHLSIYMEAGNPHRRLLDYLSQRRTLLILDNFEHLNSPESVGLLTEILSVAPQVKILVTSRSRLNVRDEYLFPLAGMTLPLAGQSMAGLIAHTSLAAFSAVELFQLSARRVQPDFQITETNFPAVVQICRQVQGMPLAIELAAAWLELLSVDEVSEEVERSLDFLGSEWHDLPERQRSLRAVFNASWKLLAGQERLVVKALSVFRASFTRQAAQGISGASTKILLELISKSWLQRQADGRYQMHELLRQFAFEKLEAEPVPLQHVEQQYCAYYAEYLQTLWKEMKGPQQTKAFQEVSTEFENIQTAWTWLVHRGQIQSAVENLLPPLFLTFEKTAKAFDLLRLVGAAIDSLDIFKEPPAHSSLLGILLTVRGAFFRNGFPVRYETFGMLLPADEDAIRRSWSLFSAAGPVPTPGFWGIVSAYLYGQIVSLDEAIAGLHQMLQHLRQENRLWELAFGLLHLAMLVLTDLEKRPERGQTDEYLSEAMRIFQSIGDEIQVAYTLRQRANLHFQQQDLPEAIRHWQATQSRLQVAGEWEAAADIYWQMGDAHLQLGQFEAAFHCYQEMTNTFLGEGYHSRGASTLLKTGEETSRYGDPGQALNYVEQSLALAQRIGDEHTQAWCCWWMGELKRISRETVDASLWYEKARVLFEKFQDLTGATFYHRSLGDIALTAGDYSAAQRQFDLSLDSALQTQHDWALVYACSGLGRAELGLGQIAAAQEHFFEALHWARKTKEKGVTMVALIRLAEFFAATGQVEKAVQLGLFVDLHYSSWRETRAQAAALVSNHAPSFSPDRLADLRESARRLGVWEVIDHLMAEKTASI